MMMQTRRTRSKKGPVAEINVVPYIDVMLVLLVIFMITTPLLNQGVKVDLPQASAQPLATQKEPIIVSVNSQGEYFLNVSAKPDEPIAAADLVVRVAAELQLSKEDNNADPRSVLIKGDQGVSYGKVVEAMVVLQKAGVERVGLMTQTPPSADTA